MRRKKEGPATGMAKGQEFTTNESYPDSDDLSRARIAKRRADTPKKYRKLYGRCMSGEASPRNAIRMQCLECWGWVQTETARCDNVCCPLFWYRPYQKSAKSPTGRVREPNSEDNGRDV